ncbi:MAG: hypothetical protein ACYDC8_15955 [Gammaproteobacteria bacterium]
MPAATEVGRNGWRQGSIIPIEAHDLLPEPARAAIKADSRLIVVSHDCDVTHGSFEDEPNVELLLAHLIQDPRGDCTHAKNPRYLHFPILNSGNEHYYEAHAASRFLVERRLLLKITPDANTTLTPDTQEIVRRWLVARYMRVAFPDELNFRLASADKKLKRAMKQLNPHLSDVYCSLNSREDLPVGEPYEINIIGVMPVEHYQDPTAREHAQQSLDVLAAAIRKCPGVEVIEADLRSEDEITLRACRYLIPLNFTYLSLREGTGAVLPVNM